METKIYKLTNIPAQAAEIEEIGALLRAGEIAAIPTETVYGLAANAFDPAAVKKIFEAKGRPQDNPLIVHIAAAEELETLAAAVPAAARALAAAFWPGPLTMILPKKDTVPDEVSAGLPTVAVRMPSHPAAQAIIRAAGVPLAAPSANISGFPSPTSAAAVIDDMAGRIPAIADGGDCGFGIESTVVTLATDPPRLLRPGAVTPEQLRAVLGALEVDDAVLHPLREGETASSPGMKYKHYAPRAALSVLRGDLADFLIYLKKHPDCADHALCFEGEETFIPLPCVTFGRRDEPLSQSHRLFDALRALDAAGSEKTLARLPGSSGVGLGICNRLFRAAGFRIESNGEGGRILGVCGLSGAGKSTFCGLLRAAGAEIVDADEIARAVTQKGSPILPALRAAFGNDVLLPDGTLDRRRLASRAFANEESAARLTAITHPEILRRTEECAKAAAAAGKTAVIDAPLLFSSRLDRICDLTFFVTAPEETRRARIRARDGLPDAEIQKRFARQTKEAALARNADVVIRNGPGDDLAAQADRLFGSPANS